MKNRKYPKKNGRKNPAFQMSPALMDSLLRTMRSIALNVHLHQCESCRKRVNRVLVTCKNRKAEIPARPGHVGKP